jgi:DNA-directed RNA polymerase subunit RPC12/RpoP
MSRIVIEPTESGQGEVTPIPPQADLPHVTPIACPKCGGKAHLIARGPDAFKRDGRSEVRIYNCDECGHGFGRTIENYV